MNYAGLSGCESVRQHNAEHFAPPVVMVVALEIGLSAVPAQRGVK